MKASRWRRPKSNMKNRFKIHSFDKRVLNEHNVPGTIFGHGNISMLSWSSQSVGDENLKEDFMDKYIIVQLRRMNIKVPV